MTALNAGADSLAALKCELAAEVLRSFGTLRFAGTGWSMLPSVWPSDTLVVERAEAGKIRVGEIVLVGRGGRLCAHRVTGIVETTAGRKWITQGDGMSIPDVPVEKTELLGRVTYLIRAGRLLPVPTKLSAVERMVAKVVRRSTPAARALVHFHHKYRASSEPIIPCPN